MLTNKRLILCHFWLAFIVFGAALALGAWQMFVRSPLNAWHFNPEFYYRSVTAHGSAMGYVFPTLIAMGFGYAITESALEKPLVGRRWAWAGFFLVAVGAVVAMIPVSLGFASVLYTFYPPMVGNPFYYIGVVMVVVGSWIWVALMSINMAIWKRENPGKPVPLAMFANVAGAYLWGWTAVGAALEIIFQILPVALGLRSTIDAGLARVFFSWTLHAIVYFWLFPTYIAYYTIFPRAIGGRLYSDAMARISFILFVVVAMPIGIHHLFADPQVGAGFKFMHSVFTGLVALPTLLTVFTICASAEIASRLRGGRGAFGWVTALPWSNPIMLATALSLVMLGFGGAGGLINMSYQLDASVHNTQWITGHFHLIFGGAIVIMYFAIAYDLWPHLTGRALESFGLMRTQLWLWFIGMIVTTFPWHYVGILGMPRRMAFYDYANPAISPQAFSVSMSAIGGFILLISGILFLTVLIRGQRSAAERGGRLPVCRAVAHAGADPGRAEQFWAVARADDRAHRRQLRLSDRAVDGAEGNQRARGLCRSQPMSEQPLFSLRNPWFSASVGVTAGDCDPCRLRRPDLAAAGTAGPQAQRHLGCDLQRRRRATRVEPERRHPAGFQDVECGDDVRDADAGRSSLYRSRGDAGAALRDLSRAAGRQRRQLAESRRAVRRRHLQATDRFQGRRARQRRHDAVRSQSEQPGHAGYRGLLRLSAARALAQARPQIDRACDRHDRRPDAQHRALRLLSWRHRRQGRQSLARRPVGGLHQGATAGVCGRHPPQRHQPADAQYRPPDDRGRDRPGRPLLRSAAVR